MDDEEKIADLEGKIADLESDLKDAEEERDRYKEMLESIYTDIKNLRL